MSPKERAAAALELRAPDDIVPTFELEFQLTSELLGRDFLNHHGLSGKEKEQGIAYNGQLWADVAERLDYSIIRLYDPDEIRWLVKEGYGDRYLLCGEADGTMAIPDGETMLDLASAMVESPQGVHENLRRSANEAKEHGKRLIDAGVQMLTMCSDYCFNRGPFLSPTMFAEFIAPYLFEVIDSHRSAGAYVVKHTDGNMMPILDQIVQCKPNGIHSLDPQGGVDIAEVKRLYGDQVCLCGNVNCGLIQTGTDEEVRQSARYALEHGMPGGGYIFSTSNVAFKGMPLERYLMILEVRAEHGRYESPSPSVR